MQTGKYHCFLGWITVLKIHKRDYKAQATRSGTSGGHGGGSSPPKIFACPPYEQTFETQRTSSQPPCPPEGIHLSWVAHPCKKKKKSWRRPWRQHGQLTSVSAETWYRLGYLVFAANWWHQSRITAVCSHYYEISLLSGAVCSYVCIAGFSWVVTWAMFLLR